MVRLLIKHSATWDNAIGYYGEKRVEAKYPYHRQVLSRDFLEFLKTMGWKGPRLFG